MNERQQRHVQMQGALAQFKPDGLTEREERLIIDKVVRNCAHIGKGPLTWLHQHWQAGQMARPVAVPARVSQPQAGGSILLACPNCGEQRFKTEKAIHGHLRVCKQKGGEKWD